MNIIEKVFPGMVAKYHKKRRELELEKLKTDFLNYSQHGASTSKNAFRGFDDSLYSADEDIGDSKEILMARSRQLYMGNSIALGAIRKLRTNIVGSGIKMKSRINNNILKFLENEVSRIEQEIQTLWEIWANSVECDITRQNNFYQLQSLALLTQLVDGECFVLLPFKKKDNELFELKIRLIDSARCDGDDGNKDIKNGVEIDKDGEVIAYHFIMSKDDSTPKRIKVYGENGRRNILVLMEKERIGQRRGVPLLAPVIEMLSQITKFTNAELANAVVSSMFTVFLKTEKNSNPISHLFPEEEVEKKNAKLGNGTIVELEAGQSIEFANPQRPNTNFDNFLFAMCKQLGTALEIPVEVLLSNFNASYSASKASLEEVWKTYRMRREWLISSFCQPIFEEWLDEAVAKGYIKLKGYFDNPLKRKAYQQAEWFGETQAQLDPLKEIKAAQLRIEAGVSTVAKEARNINGSDWEKNIEQRKKEKKMMAGLGEEAE